MQVFQQTTALLTFRPSHSLKLIISIYPEYQFIPSFSGTTATVNTIFNILHFFFGLVLLLPSSVTSISLILMSRSRTSSEKEIFRSCNIKNETARPIRSAKSLQFKHPIYFVNKFPRLILSRKERQYLFQRCRIKCR